MRIVAINRFYRPDHSATAQMLTDLAEHLAATGRSVTVVTSRMTYDGAARLPARERLCGVEVRRVATTTFGRSRLAGRAIDYATFYLSAFIALLCVGRRGDIVIAKTDPPLISIVAAAAAKLKGMTLVNWCQDLFPETAAALGMTWARGWCGQRLREARNWSLRQASLNAVLHEKMAEKLRAEAIEGARVRVLRNWAGAELRAVPPDENPLRADWGLQGRFVVGYSGNLGRAHLPERVSQLVRATLHIENLTWLFIGGGVGFERIKAEIGEAENVIFKPYQPRQRLSESLSVPDIHLITQDPASEGYVVPSKYYGVRAVGRRVLFLGEADGATARDIAREGCGVVLDPGRPSQWAPVLNSLVCARGADDFSAVCDPGRAANALEAWTSALAECAPRRMHFTSAALPLPP